MHHDVWHNMTLMASRIVPLQLLVQDDQNEIQHDFFSYLTLLALASEPCDANSIVRSTTVFTRSRQMKQCETKLFWSCDAGVSVT